MTSPRAKLSIALLAPFVFACSSGAPPLTWSNGTSGTQPGPDAAPPPDPIGPPSATYPAPHPALPLVDFHGGRVLDAPKLVTVTFDGDPLDNRIGTFGDVVGGTEWWTEVSAGYCARGGSPCVGRPTHAAHVVLPASVGTQVQSGLADSAASDATPLKDFPREQIAKNRLPAPTPETLYMVFFPQGVQLSTDGVPSCQSGGFAGYHGSMTYTPKGADAGGPIELPYAVLPRCSQKESFLTHAASHELIEAATDPFVPDAEEGYVLKDELWSVIAGGEVGDMCIDVTGGGADEIVEGGFTLQRSWSNAAVQAGKNPCVPVPDGEVYFNTAPAVADVTLAVGETQTIELDGFSDAPNDDWTVDALDVLNASGYGSYLRLTVAPKLVNNGTKSTLSVTLLQAPPASDTIGLPLVVESGSGGHVHFWPAVVHAK